MNKAVEQNALNYIPTPCCCSKFYAHMLKSDHCKATLHLLFISNSVCYQYIVGLCLVCISTGIGFGFNGKSKFHMHMK